MRDLTWLENDWVAQGLRLVASDALKNGVFIPTIENIIKLSEEFNPQK